MLRIYLILAIANFGLGLLTGLLWLYLLKELGYSWLTCYLIINTIGYVFSIFEYEWGKRNGHKESNL